MKAKYEITTGKILCILNCSPSQYGCNTAEDEALIDCDPSISDDTYYVSDGVVTARPATPAKIDKNTIDVDGLDEATITLLPNSTKIQNHTSGAEITVTDGTLTITADSACRIILNCVSFPYLDKEFTINAT